jgi:hypothetical protein
MNAYELADELENKDRLWNVDENLMLKNCAMLRQQADHIAELENQLDKCSHHEAMAHQSGYELGKASQIKELSDEEIQGLIINKVTDADMIRQALKKASEK